MTPITNVKIYWPDAGFAFICSFKSIFSNIVRLSKRRVPLLILVLFDPAGAYLWRMASAAARLSLILFMVIVLVLFMKTDI